MRTVHTSYQGVRRRSRRICGEKLRATVGRRSAPGDDAVLMDILCGTGVKARVGERRGCGRQAGSVAAPGSPLRAAAWSPLDTAHPRQACGMERGGRERAHQVAMLMDFIVLIFPQGGFFFPSCG